MRRYTCPPLVNQPQAQFVCMVAIQNSKISSICLPPPTNQSTPASISSILPQSTSELDTDQDDIIDETIKQVTQSVNQTLLKTNVGSSTKNITLNDLRHTVHQKMYTQM